VLNHIVYDSFGQVTSESDPTVDFRFGYTGRELDAETELMYYRARYYNGEIGRFISEDPIGFESEDVNLFRYVSNNPLTIRDPSGLYGRTVLQQRIINYRTQGVDHFTTNILDVVRASRNSPLSTWINSDDTTAYIAYSRDGHRSAPTVDRRNIPGIRPWPIDARGHIVGAQLGGSNSDPNNFFAQLSRTNNGSWKFFETAVRDSLDMLNTAPCFGPQRLVYRVSLNYRPFNSYVPPYPRRPNLRPVSYIASGMFTPIGIPFSSGLVQN
jgi:RHS repeat-associated protein